MKCPNCGQQYEDERCPNCGRPRTTGRGRTAAVIIAVLLVLPCAAFGACTTMIGAGEAANWRDPTFLAIVGGCAAFVIGGIFVVTKLWRG